MDKSYIKYYDRTKENVIEFWKRTEDSEIKRLFPKTSATIDDALLLFEQSKLKDSRSYGQTINVDGCYIGDVWLFAIDETDEKMAMLSIVIFNKDYWGKGIGKQVIKYFTRACFKRFDIDHIGAVVYAHNVQSLHVLKGVGFEVKACFSEHSVKSKYLELYQ